MVQKFGRKKWCKIRPEKMVQNSAGKLLQRLAESCCKGWPKVVAKVGQKLLQRLAEKLLQSSVQKVAKNRPKNVVKKAKCDQYLLWILRAVFKLGTNWLENCMNNDGEIFSIKFKPECCQNINAKPRPFKGCLDVDRKLQPFLGMPQQNVDREASIFSREAGRSESFCVDRETLLHWQKLDHVVHFVVLTSIGTTWMLRPGFHCMQPEIHCIDTNLHRKRSMAFFT